MEFIEIDKQTGEIRVYTGDSRDGCNFCDKKDTCEKNKFDCLVPCG